MVNFKEHRLDLMKQSIGRYISKTELSHMYDAEVYLDYVAEDMVVTLATRIPYKDIKEIRHPEDWWQHVKERWFPSFLLKRFPVKYKKYVATVFYPDLPIPREQNHIVIREVETNGINTGGPMDEGRR